MPESTLDAFYHVQPLGWGLFLCFAVLVFIRILLIGFFYGRVAFYKIPVEKEKKPVSVLMVFRNEEENLRSNLSSLLELKNVEYEVVTVDDFSSDSSFVVVGALMKQYRNLRVSSINQDTRYSEKLARNIALKGAGNNWVVYIPPSVTSLSPSWLSNVSSRLNGQLDVAVGYSNVAATRSLLNLLFRLEFFFQQLNSFGFIVNGMPYVVSEDNVVFKKQNYFEKGGYGNKLAEPYAHLELVINSFVKRKSAGVFLSGAFGVKLHKRVELKDYFELLVKEKRIQSYLSLRRRLFLIINDLSELLLFPSAIVALILVPGLWLIFLTGFLVVMLCYSVIIKKILYRLDERKLFLPSLLVALLRPYFKLFFRIVHRIAKRKKDGREKNKSVG